MVTKNELYAMLTGVFTASLIVSNIVSFKTFDFFSFTLPCAVIIFPIIYIVNDVLAEIYGYEKARNVIILGFIVNLGAVIVYIVYYLMFIPFVILFLGCYSLLSIRFTKLSLVDLRVHIFY